MKISNYIYAGAARSYSKSDMKNKTKVSAAFSDVLDTVEISSDGNNYLKENDDVRMNKVNLIKEEISLGRYRFDAAATASNMLRSYLY